MFGVKKISELLPYYLMIKYRIYWKKKLHLIIIINIQTIILSIGHVLKKLYNLFTDYFRILKLKG